jgi:hypothetical protein
MSSVFFYPLSQEMGPDEDVFFFSKKHFCGGFQQIGMILFLLQLQAQAKDLNIPR